MASPTRIDRAFLEPVTTARRVLLRDVRVLDVHAGALGPATAVLVQDGRVVDLAAPLDPADATVVDGNGWTLLPGLIDTHTHVLSPFVDGAAGMTGPWVVRQMQRNLAASLAAGVVCVRDLLSPLRLLLLADWHAARGLGTGPRIVAAGPMLTCPDGYPDFIPPMPAPVAALIGQTRQQVRSAGHARRVVRALARKGAQVIKVGYARLTPGFDPRRRHALLPAETLAAIGHTAHAVGLPVAVHHHCNDDLAALLAAPIDSLEHVPYDRVLSAAQAEAVATRGLTVVPTLTITDGAAFFERKAAFLASARAADFFEPTALAHLRWLAEHWADREDDPRFAVFGFSRANTRNAAMCFESVRRLHAAGARICAGTDLGAQLAFPGEVAGEVARLHAAGLSRLEALRAATIGAARLLRVDHELGSIEHGKAADVIAVAGNPLEDLGALRAVRLVGSRGRWFRPVAAAGDDFWSGQAHISGAPTSA